MINSYNSNLHNRQYLSPRKHRDFRILFLFVFFGFVSLLILFRLYKLQIKEHEYYLAIASDQHEIFKRLYPVRGNIYVHDQAENNDLNGDEYFPVAMNQNLNLLYAVPKAVKDPEAVLGVLKEVFDVNEDKDFAPEEIAKESKSDDDNDTATEIIPPKELTKEEKEKKIKDNELVNEWRAKLNKSGDPYEPLRHFVTDVEMEKIKSYNLVGIYSAKEISRFYPEKNIGSQLIGFVGKQSESNVLKGYYGLESCYDKDLAGTAGFLQTENDSAGRWIAAAGKDIRLAEDGQDVYLTIDKTVQFYVCSQLEEAMKKYEADKGSALIMDPVSGKIIAWCNVPDFDPNKYYEIKDLNTFRDMVAGEAYESGSVFKPVTIAAAMDAGKIDPFTTYLDTGEVKIANYTIRNSDLKAHGIQTMTQVLESSLNTGTIFAVRKIGLDTFKNYVKKFGFGEKSDIDICGEAKGNINSLNEKSDLSLATASYGQGITVTPLQLALAYSVIANEGKLIKPYIIEKIVNKNGDIIKENKPQVVSQVISEQTARLVASMLTSVVKSGHAKGAAIAGYMVGGKTGTANIPDLVNGGYLGNTIHTFAGFAPFNNPRFVAVLKLDNVKTSMYAESSVVPLFGKIGKFILDYYHIPPEVK